MSDEAKPTGALNAKGNRRGMNPGSREALKRARPKPRSDWPHDPRTGNFVAAGSSGKLRGVSRRVRKFIREMNENPDLLEQALIGGLLASLKDSADWERQAWEDIRARRDSVKPEDDPDGSKRIQIDHEVLPIVEEARKSRKLAQDLVARAAEIKARLRAGGGLGYLEDKYGDQQTNESKDERVEPGAPAPDISPDQPLSS